MLGTLVMVVIGSCLLVGILVVMFLIIRALIRYSSELNRKKTL